MAKHKVLKLAFLLCLQCISSTDMILTLCWMKGKYLLHLATPKCYKLCTIVFSRHLKSAHDQTDKTDISKPFPKYICGLLCVNS